MPIRVLFLTTDSRICGTERRILSLSRHLDPRRFTPFLVTLSGNGDLVEKSLRAGIPALNLRLEEGVLQGLKKWRHFLREVCPDVIQSLLFHSNLWGRATVLCHPEISMISGVSTIYSVREYGRLYGILEKWGRSIDRFYVANSMAGMRSVLRIMGMQGKVTLIPNGIEPSPYYEEREKWRVAGRRRWNIQETDRVVGIVAQLRPAKRHDLLIRAVAKWKDFPGLKLLVVGSGEREKELRSLAKKEGMEEKTIFTGYQEDARRLMPVMDIFALPSMIEGQSVSLMEAMQMGLPVISTPVGGIPEFVKHMETGLLVEPGNQEAFSRSLGTLLGDEKKREEIGRKARLSICETFTVERMTRQFEALYEACVKQHFFKG